MNHRLMPLVQDMRKYAKTILRERHWLKDDAEVISSWADEIENHILTELYFLKVEKKIV